MRKYFGLVVMAAIGLTLGGLITRNTFKVLHQNQQLDQLQNQVKVLNTKFNPVVLHDITIVKCSKGEFNLRNELGQYAHYEWAGFPKPTCTEFPLKSHWNLTVLKIPVPNPDLYRLLDYEQLDN